MTDIKVLVADANSGFRESLCRFLESRFPGMTVRNSDAQGLIRKVREFAPEIIILETSFDYLRKIRKQSGGAKIIMLTAHNIPEYLEAGRSYGADHVFCKDRVGLPEIQRLVEIIAREAADSGKAPGRGDIRKKNKGNGVQT